MDWNLSQFASHVISILTITVPCVVLITIIFCSSKDMILNVDYIQILTGQDAIY